MNCLSAWLLVLSYGVMGDFIFILLMFFFKFMLKFAFSSYLCDYVLWSTGMTSKVDSVLAYACPGTSALQPFKLSNLMRLVLVMFFIILHNSKIKKITIHSSSLKH